MVGLRMEIDKCAKFILDTLDESGYEAYVVGGSIRNYYIGEPARDWNISTNAKPDEIRKIFKNLGLSTIEVGNAKQTVGILINSLYVDVLNNNWDRIVSNNYSDPEIYNITTFNYKDNEQSNIEYDLSKRDFTMNAIAYSSKRELIDLFNGVSDISNKIIRCIGDPYDNLKEDPVRILRALVFQARLGFCIEENTKKAIDELAYLVEDIDPIRKQRFLLETLHSKYVYKAMSMNREVIAHLIPEIRCTFDFDQRNPHHTYTLYKHLIKTVDMLVIQGETDSNLLTASLLHDIAKPNSVSLGNDGNYHYPYHTKLGACISENVLTRLSFNEKDIKEITTMIKYHDTRFTSKNSLRKFVNNHSIETAEKLLKLQYADVVNQSTYKTKEKIDRTIKCRYWLDEIRVEKPVFGISDIEINGKDLIDMGFKPGPLFRTILEDCLNQVTSDSISNDKFSLMRFVETKYK